MAQSSNFVTEFIHFLPVEKQVRHTIPEMSIDQPDARSSDQQHHRGADSAGLRRARQAAEQARAVATAVAIATAAAADRVTSDRAHYDAHHDVPGDSAGDRGGGESWRCATLTERALQLHESRSAARSTPRDIAAALAAQWPGSRFDPDALPFHCAADYYSHAGLRSVAAQRT